MRSSMPECLSTVQGGRLDHLQGVEAGLAQQLQLADVAEAVQLVDIASYRSRP